MESVGIAKLCKESQGYLPPLKTLGNPWILNGMDLHFPWRRSWQIQEDASMHGPKKVVMGIQIPRSLWKYQGHPFGKWKNPCQEKRREVVRAHRTEVIASRSELLSLHCPRHLLLLALLPACAGSQVIMRQDFSAYAVGPKENENESVNIRKTKTNKLELERRRRIQCS